MSRLARTFLALLVVVAAAVVTASPASAHDPLFLTDEQATPQTGPLLPDGTISFAIYGTVKGDGDTRGFQVRYAEGDRLFIELLIPATSPETELAEADLPFVTVTRPDGSAFDLVPETRDRFDEPFSNTSYLRLAGVDGTAMAGVHDVLVTGRAPSRFTVAVGTTERFSTPVERADNRPSSVTDIGEQLDTWYTTPPPGTSGGSADSEALGTPSTPLPTATAAPTPTGAPAPSPAPTVNDAPTPTAAAASPDDRSEVAGTVESDDGNGGASAITIVAALAAAVAVVAAFVLVRRQRRRGG